MESHIVLAKGSGADRHRSERSGDADGGGQEEQEVVATADWLIS